MGILEIIKMTWQKLNGNQWNVVMKYIRFKIGNRNNIGVCCLACDFYLEKDHGLAAEDAAVDHIKFGHKTIWAYVMLAK
jgi:hypothetical protein